MWCNINIMQVILLLKRSMACPQSVGVVLVDEGKKSQTGQTDRRLSRYTMIEDVWVTWHRLTLANPSPLLTTQCSSQSSRHNYYKTVTLILYFVGEMLRSYYM